MQELFQKLMRLRERERESKHTSGFVKFLFSFFLFVTFFFAFHSSVYAATYYVRADGTVLAANKANATSPNAVGTALNMAQVKLATFSASDQILFSSQGGNYTEIFTIPSGGSGVGTEITYANVPTETPVIAITSGDTLDTNSKSNIIIQGLTINYIGISASSNIGINITTGSNITFRNIFSDMGGWGYNMWSNSVLSTVIFDHVTLTNCRTAVPNCLVLSGSSNSNVTIQNLIASANVNLSNITTGTIANSTITGKIIVSAGSNISITNSTVGGITLDSVTTGTISNVVESGGAATGFIFTNSSYITVNDSSVAGSTAYGAFQAGAFAGGAPSHDITYNRVTANNNLASGFVAQDTSYNITYNNCTADNNSNIGFLARSSANNVTYWRSEASYNGTINMVTDGAGFLPHNNATNVKCYYCIAHHNYTMGIGDVSTGTNLFYNSISWANGYAVGDTFKGSVVTIPSTRGNIYMSSNKSAGSVTIKNTISGAGKPREMDSAANSAYTILDYNLYYPLDNNAFFSTDEINNTSWTTYHLTNEAHSQNANPLFNDSINNNFTLQSNSPAIDAGVNLGLTQDFVGTSVPQGSAPDIGAYEYIPSTTPGTSSSSSSSSSTSAPSCGNSVTNDIPNLFEIRTNKNTATLYFAPPTAPYSSFYIAYSRKPNVLEYGVEYNQSYSGSGGVLKYTINMLQPNTKYYFKIRAGNGCATGNWGNTMTATTTSSTTQQTYYKNFPIVINNLFSRKENTNSLVASPNPSSTPKPIMEIQTPTPIQTTLPSQTQPASTPKFCILWWCF